MSCDRNAQLAELKHVGINQRIYKLGKFGERALPQFLDIALLVLIKRELFFGSRSPRGFQKITCTSVA